MSDETSKTNWHSGFYSAMKVEYGDVIPGENIKTEVRLGEQPLRCDMVLSTNGPLSDIIGRNFRKTNIIEYKSPEDRLTLDDFYKGISYALLYKIVYRGRTQIPLSDLSITFIKCNYPKELFENVIKDGGKIKTTSPGVFIIEGILRIPCQVIVTNQLPHGMYNGFQLLTKKATKEQVIAYLNENLQKDPDTIWSNMRVVLSICFHVNPNLLKEVHKMPEYTNFFDQFIGEAEEKGMKEGQKKTEARIVLRLLEMGTSVDVIFQATQIGPEDFSTVVQKAGLFKGSVVTDFAKILLKQKAAPEEVAKLTNLSLQEVSDLAKDLSLPSQAI